MRFPQWVYGGLTVLVGLLAAGAHAGDWTFGGGPVARLGMRVTVSGGSETQAEGLHAATPSMHLPGVAPKVPADGGSSGYADREFDDGFVFMDAGTADPNSLEPGLTWHWGYDDASQYDAGVNTLSFHRTTVDADVQYGSRVTVSMLRDTTVALDDTLNAMGMGLWAGYGVMESESVAMRVCAGVRGLWGANSHLEGSTYEERAQQDRLKVTDTSTYRDTYVYDTTGITPQPAPYAGSYDGPGPTIPNVPASYHRDDLGGGRVVAVDNTSVWTARNQMSFDLDTSVYDLWIGPQVSVELGKRFSLNVLPSLQVNYVDVDIRRTETFTAFHGDGSAEVLRSWSERRSQGDWVFGAGVAIGGQVRIGRGWSVELGGGYDWIAEKVAVNLGPNTVTINPSGYTLGASVLMQF